MSYYLEDLEREHYTGLAADDDVLRCPWCLVQMRCKDEECNVAYCPECGYEDIS